MSLATTEGLARPDDERVQAVRDGRWAAHAWLRSNSMRGGAKVCMKAAMVKRPGSVKPCEVTVSVFAGGDVHVSGAQRCGSSSACPVCGPIVRQRRAEQLDKLAARALAAGCSIYMVSAKVSHHAGDSLEDCIKGIQHAWSKAFSGSAMKRVDYIGQARSWDFTYGTNGFHPHIHALVVFGASVTAAEAEGWLLERGTVYVTRLADSTVLHGDGTTSALGAALDDRGWHVSSCSTAGAASRYVVGVKGPEGHWGAGLELARGDLKRGRRGSCTPFELLDRAVAGDRGAAKLWHVYEAATHGLRCVIVGKVLSAMFGVDELASEDDKKAAQQAPEPVARAVLSMTFEPREWDFMLTSGRVPSILRALQAKARRMIRDSGPPSGLALVA